MPAIAARSWRSSRSRGRPFSGAFKVLNQAGLIHGEIEGPRTCYWPDRERLAALHGLVGALLRDAVALNEDGCGADY